MSECPRCHDSGVEVVDVLLDGTNVLGDCRDCVELAASKLEAQREDADDERREMARLDAAEDKSCCRGGARPEFQYRNAGINPNYDGLD